MRRASGCAAQEPYAEMDVSDARLTSPAVERNKAPILSVLERVLPKKGLVLEVASGSGQHVVCFADAFPGLRWQPSDPNPACRASIAAWVAPAGVANVAEPLDLDVRSLPWPVPLLDAIVCINLVHISPWSATTALFRGAKRALRDEGVLYLYGPYFVRGKPAAPSNEAFDRSLREQNPEWGVRELDDVIHVATQEEFAVVETIEMPANNLSVVLRKRCV